MNSTYTPAPADLTHGEQNLLLLESLIPADEKLYVWCYNRQGQFLASSCPKDQEQLLQDTFSNLGGLTRLLEEMKTSSGPLLIGSPIGLTWAASAGAERDQALLFVTGPVFYSSPNKLSVRSALMPYSNISPDSSDWVGRFCRALPSLPVMSFAVFNRYVILVHNALTGSQLGVGAIFSQEHENRGTLPQASPDSPPSAPLRDRVSIYRAEQQLLAMVREGNINYFDAFRNSSLISPGVPVGGRDPLRQGKTSIIVFITLVSRAAMEGGLSPEIAYDLGDSYIQSVENCNDTGELSALATAMYHDFIYRVHHARRNPAYSLAIQKCCDYIDLHITQKIKTGELAALAGYSDYYLTEKFKNETGESLSSYIRRRRIERACLMLDTTDLGVAVIARELSFTTVNYFIQTFKAVKGMTPAEYRKRQR